MAIVRATHLCDYMDWTSVDLNLTREGFFCPCSVFSLKKKKKKKTKERNKLQPNQLHTADGLKFSVRSVPFFFCEHRLNTAVVTLVVTKKWWWAAFIRPTKQCLMNVSSFHRVKDYANRVKSSLPLRSTNSKSKTKYIPRRVRAYSFKMDAICLYWI